MRENWEIWEGEDVKEEGHGGDKLSCPSDRLPPPKLVVSLEGSTIMGATDDKLLELTILVAPARSSTFAFPFLPTQFSFSLILSSMTDGRSGGLPRDFFDSPVRYVRVTNFSAGPDQTHRSCYAQLIGSGFVFGYGSSFIDPSDW